MSGTGGLGVSGETGYPRDDRSDRDGATRVVRVDGSQRTSVDGQSDDNATVDVEDLLLFSDGQYAGREAWNAAQQSSYHIIPERLDHDLPVYRVLSMQQRISISLARRRFATTLLGVFACLALALATIGIYSVLAYLVSQGTRELGIRMALGATQRTVVALIVTQGMKLAFVGVGVGLALAFALGRLINGFLFGVPSSDLATFAATSLLLVIVALLASYVPARRASRIDPMISLRSE